MTDFSKDLDKLELGCLKQGYSACLTDLYLTLADLMTPENTKEFMEIKARMEHMESVRHETGFKLPKDL